MKAMKAMKAKKAKKNYEDFIETEFEFDIDDINAEIKTASTSGLTNIKIIISTNKLQDYYGALGYFVSINEISGTEFEYTISWI